MDNYHVWIVLEQTPEHPETGEAGHLTWWAVDSYDSPSSAMTEITAIKEDIYQRTGFDPEALDD